MVAFTVHGELIGEFWQRHFHQFHLPGSMGDWLTGEVADHGAGVNAPTRGTHVIGIIRKGVLTFG